MKKDHKIALNLLYGKFGVGSTTKHKLAFWESRHPDGYSISHNPTDKVKVEIFQMVYLVDEFPKDFISC
jgi:hypothetical protein